MARQGNKESQRIMPNAGNVSSNVTPFERRQLSPGQSPRESAPVGDRPCTMFADEEDMKQKVREALLKPEYNVADYYKDRGFWRDLATNRIFEYATLGVIGLNAAWLAYDTDNNDAPMLVEADPIFVVVENLFCLYFSFEWFARFMAFEQKSNGMKDAWFVFDSALVFMMVLETWVMSILVIIFDAPTGNVGGASVLRLFRLLRLSRMARMLRSMPELMILIKGMLAACRSVFFTMLLLFIMIYIFAIALRQLTDGSAAGEKYFPSMFKAMWVLLINGTLLDDLTNVADEIMDSSLWFALIFLIFVSLSALMVMNMLIGVLCEVVSAVAKSEQEQMAVHFVRGKMSDIMQKIDLDGDGTISRREFERILDSNEAIQALCEVGVDPEGLVDVGLALFTDSDSANSGEEPFVMAFSDFMEVVLSLRGSNHACVKDIVAVQKAFRAEILQLDERMSKVLTETHARTPGNASIASRASIPRPKAAVDLDYLDAPNEIGLEPSAGHAQLRKPQKEKRICTAEYVATPLPPPPLPNVPPLPDDCPEFAAMVTRTFDVNDRTSGGSQALALLSRNDLGDASPAPPQDWPVSHDAMTLVHDDLRALARYTSGSCSQPLTSSFTTVGNFAKIDVLLRAVLAELQQLQIHGVPGCLGGDMPRRSEQLLRQMERMIITYLREFHFIHQHASTID